MDITTVAFLAVLLVAGMIWTRDWLKKNRADWPEQDDGTFGDWPHIEGRQ